MSKGGGIRRRTWESGREGVACICDEHWANARRFRTEHRLGVLGPDGRRALAFGFRVGYWPCLKAPYIEAAVGPHRFQLWHGLPSYQQDSYS